MANNQLYAGAFEAPAYPAIRNIDMADLGDALARGVADFRAMPSHILFLCVLYPIICILLSRFALHDAVLPLLFPLVSGFSLLGPVAAIFLLELSSQREQGHRVGWRNSFAVFRSPSIGAIVAVGLVLLALFVAWLWAALALYGAIMGDDVPGSMGAFLGRIFSTEAGWTLIVVGNLVGFLFAVVVLAISVVSLPLLVDRHVGATLAVVTSIRAVLANPGPMAAWGLIVACLLIAGSIPFFVGLAVVMPVLGHATWHLYRKIVVP